MRELCIRGDTSVIVSECFGEPHRSGFACVEILLFPFVAESLNSSFDRSEGAVPAIGVCGNWQRAGAVKIERGEDNVPCFGILIAPIYALEFVRKFRQRGSRER
jgi:hypothetical protein